MNLVNSVKCFLPCAWFMATLLIGTLVITYRRGRLIYRGPMPSDGPNNGFASQREEIAFFDVTDQITRETFKAGTIMAIVCVIGTAVMYLVSRVI
jgi:hypothetical protein